MPDTGPPPSGETLEHLRTELDRLYAAQQKTTATFWTGLPQRTKVLSVAVAAILAAGVLLIPVTAAAAYQQRFEAEHGLALRAVGLAEAKADAEAYNAALAGFTIDLRGFADEATSTRLFDARNELAQAIQGGDVGVIERARASVAAHVAEVAEATAVAQERRAVANPGADEASKHAVTVAVAAVRAAVAGDGDVLAALIDLKAVAEAVADASGGSPAGGAAEAAQATGPLPEAALPAAAPVRVQANGTHVPGCGWGPRLWYASHTPGAGGTAVITLREPYDYAIDGQTVHVYLCALG